MRLGSQNLAYYGKVRCDELPLPYLVWPSSTVYNYIIADFIKLFTVVIQLMGSD